MEPIDAATVRARHAAVLDRVVAAGGDAAAVTVVAVTKGFGAEAVVAARDAGLLDVGENYAVELKEKASAVDDPRLRWHFVGRVQRNKVATLAARVALWQSVDRLAAGLEIARRRPGAAVLVQVGVSGQPQQGGCPPDETGELVARLADAGLDVRGLMAIGPQGGADEVGAAFRLVSVLADDLGLEQRSMGMSADLEHAVRAGATMVRIGRDLFGQRPLRPPRDDGR